MKHKGIWLPIEIIQDNNITWLEKILLMEINQLCMLDKGCIASNEHFAELLGMKKNNISRSIHSLESKKYITVEVSNRNHTRVIKMILGGYQNDIDRYQNDNSLKRSKQGSKQYNKKTSKKEKYELPDWLNKKAWTEWEQHRKEIKKTLTPAAVKKQISFLEKNKHQHVDIIHQSIMNGWTGLFAIKNQQSGNSTMDLVDRVLGGSETVEVEVIE